MHPDKHQRLLDAGYRIMDTAAFLATAPQPSRRRFRILHWGGRFGWRRGSCWYRNRCLVAW